MKLYDVPRNTLIRVVAEEAKVPPAAPELPAGMELNFGHVDGMYSYCTTDDGQVVHLAAWEEVEIVDDD